MEVVIVDLNGDDIVRAEVRRRGDVQSARADLIFVESDLRAVDVKRSTIANALELDEDFSVLGARVEREVLAVPREAAVAALNRLVGGEADPVDP